MGEAHAADIKPFKGEVTGSQIEAKTEFEEKDYRAQET